METARFAHVATCWFYLGALVFQFALAGYGVMGGDLEPHMAFGGTLLHIVVPLLLVTTALVARLGWRQVAWSFGLFVLLTVQILLVEVGRELGSNAVQGLHPAVALLSAGYVYWLVLVPARAPSTWTARDGSRRLAK